MKNTTQKLTIKLALVALIFSFSPINAQDDAASSAGSVEEITVTGSQIKGAKITGALPVSVLDFTDIDTLGVDGGDELLDNVVENGMNLFNETENASGGVNSACLLYTSDAADDMQCVDLGGRSIIRCDE